jgi:hypothetical protein
MKKKMRKFVDGGETARESSGGMEYLKSLTRAEQPKSGVDRLRSDIKTAGRAGMSAAKTAAESIPVIRGAKELASRVGQKSMPKSYDEEMGMKKGGKVKKMAKGGVTRADGCVMKGHTKGKMVTMKKGRMV